MPEIVKTMKLHLKDIPDGGESSFLTSAERYASACDFISQYVFDNGFPLNFMALQKALYDDIRDQFGLKSQMAISAFKTVTARYKTLEESFSQHPWWYKDEDGKDRFIARTLEWLQKSIKFRRPQIDLVRNRDYSFLSDGRLSVNTLDGRVKVGFDRPECFEKYFDGSWSFGTAKLVSLKGQWYLHIPCTKEIPDTFDIEKPAHVVGIDRGLRFLLTTYDEKGKTVFASGKEILRKREQFIKTRAELQAKGTKSAKRALKRISGRENRWMTDINHQLSKTLTDTYGAGTLYALEDLTDVSFSEENLSHRDAAGRSELRSWAFYQFEKFLEYKAEAAGSMVKKFDPSYTSQRCPRCGRIHKDNRKHKTHEYVCDACGYRSNDDRIAAMNIYMLGTMHVSGDTNPRFGKRKVN